MTFSTIHTTYGLQQMAAAEGSGVPINLPTMAVGDGGGNPTTPDPSQTTLVREMYRAAVNRIYQPDPSGNPLLYAAELIVPATVGGFTLREVGVIDANGGMYLVGNLPDTYKPNSSEGAFSDTVVRVQFMVSNAGVVTLQVDPNVAVATQSWVSNNVTAATIIPGGTTHQMLRKKSNADGDTEWADPTDVNVVVTTIEEHQTLALGQTAVTLATCTTTGCALYIEGTRLQNSEWTIVDATHLTLNTPAAQGGLHLTAVQNEPAGAVPFPLIQSLNLSDVLDTSVARANLNVYSKAEADQKAPPGKVGYFAGTTAPAGWLKANGAAVSRTAYAALFAYVGTTFGAGDGTNTFNLPDLRGEFVRGFDDGRGLDGGRTFGSEQLDGLGTHAHSASSATSGVHSHTGNTSQDPGHTHTGNTSTDPGHTHPFNAVEGGGIQSGNSTGRYSDGPVAATTGTGGTHSHTITTAQSGVHSHTLTTSQDPGHTHAITVGSSGGSETRPRNIALLACIKY